MSILFQHTFDTVSHGRLIKKLDCYKGIWGKFLQCIEEYFCGKGLSINVGGAFSKWVEVNSGVSYGLGLGPKLFFICINDLPKCKESYLNVFVDDAKHHERSEKRG